MKLLKKANKIWVNSSIRGKISMFTASIAILIILCVTGNIIAINYSISGFRDILDENTKSERFLNAMEEETRVFKNYIMLRSDKNRREFEASSVKTKELVNNLTYDYNKMSKERYALVWSIRKSYDAYELQRNMVLQLSEESENYVGNLYKVYEMQKYLTEYGLRLSRVTMNDGNGLYIHNSTRLYMLPCMIFILGMMLVIGVFYVAELLNKALLKPVVAMADASKRIAENDYHFSDIELDTKDEMGELVSAFNKMRYSTEQYILMLEEKKNIMEQLHNEELAKLEIEKRLDAINLELLKNQMNPHFLFNTLNVIAGMANIESAETTEKMIKSFSSLFRYMLKTPEPYVSLSQELKVVEDYMYLQQMRFGSRVAYDVISSVDVAAVKVPTFLLQPLVENAIIHGISKKESGGYIRIRIYESAKAINILVGDTGVGMSEDRLEALRAGFMSKETGSVGIGIGNIYSRIKRIYADGDLKVYSKPDKGTVIWIVINNDMVTDR